MFVDLVGVSDFLPATYEEWISRQNGKEIDVTITLQGYKDYVNASGLSFDWATLGAYAVYAHIKK